METPEMSYTELKKALAEMHPKLLPEKEITDWVEFTVSQKKKIERYKAIFRKLGFYE